MQLNAEGARDKIEPLFRDNFKNFGELGAWVSIWHNETNIVDLAGGFRDAQRERPWDEDTLVLIWSATKGIGAACLLHVLQNHKIDLDAKVARFWPEFGQNGKENVTLAQLLSHQAGLCLLDRKVDILEYHDVIQALEEQAPIWPPGTAHGYHARTFGFLLDELVRRMTGGTLSEYWRRTFAEPLNLDLWIGLPESENARVATIYAAKADKSPQYKSRQSGSQFYVDLATKGTIANKVFTSPAGLPSVSGMNNREIRAYPNVSAGGIGSAKALGKFYAMLANGGRWGELEFFTSKNMSWMTTTLADGVDRVFQVPTAFSAGFMKDSSTSNRRIFGPSPAAFGHPGAGGSHAFADPDNNVSFAYVMNQMEQSVLPTEKCLRLVDAIYA